MFLLTDLGRQSVVSRLLKKTLRRPQRRSRQSPPRQRRQIRLAQVQTEPTSQAVKSAGTWPDSVSNFFHPERTNARVLNDGVAVSEGDGGGGGSPPTTETGGDGGPDETDDGEGPNLLSLAEAESLAAKKGAHLPSDFVKAAKGTGLRLASLQSFLHLQSLAWAGLLVRSFPWIRDRLIADPAYLFKVLTEVVIDSGCATVAEVHKRGADFFDEFEFYLSDMIVGLVLDVALVSLLAPVAVVGAKPAASSLTGLQKYLARLPSALFEANIPGLREYSLSQRLVSFFYKALQYSVIGFFCGLVGQGTANSFMMLRRHIAGGATEADVPVPPLFKTALVWGLFMAVSSNTRYQTVVGLERLVDMSIAKRIPQIAYFTTIVIRFANNVIGGENFIDMARWAGIQ